MPCGPTCVCLGADFECLAVLDPINFGYMAGWCASGTEHQRSVVLGRSRLGVTSPGPTTLPANPHAERRELIHACDYRVESQGLEKGAGCGCAPAVRCLLRRGKWSDDLAAVAYDDCLTCVS